MIIIQPIKMTCTDTTAGEQPWPGQMWVAETNYDTGDEVVYWPVGEEYTTGEWVVYRSRTDGNVGNIPPENSMYWDSAYFSYEPWVSEVGGFTGSGYPVGCKVYHEGGLYVGISSFINSSHAPDEYPAEWQPLGSIGWLVATDGKLKTLAVGTNSAYWDITAAGIDAFSVIGVTGASAVSCTLTDSSAGLVYNKTYGIPAAEQNLIVSRTFFDIPGPTYPTATIKIVVTAATTGGKIYLQELVGGIAHEAGGAQYGAELSIKDFSRVEQDTWGNFQIIERAYSRRMDLTLKIPNADVPAVYALLSTFRARPAVFVAASGTSYDSMLTLYGLCRDFRTILTGPAISECRLQILGLT